MVCFCKMLSHSWLLPWTYGCFVSAGMNSKQKSNLHGDIVFFDRKIYIEVDDAKVVHPSS
jgi:hypothetical protein